MNDHSNEPVAPVPPYRQRLLEVAKVFTKLGIIGFGGPAAHIAMMEDECVTRRQWLTRDAFMDLIGATNLIPGPNSTEMTMHMGYLRAGLPGMIVGGSCFIIPAALMVCAIAWGYTTWGTLPQVQTMLYGIKPVVLAIIAAVMVRLVGTAVKDHRLGILALTVAALSLFSDLPELALLFGGGLIGGAWRRIGLAREKANMDRSQTALPLLGQGSGPMLMAGAGVAAGTALTVTSWQIFWYFLKIGSVLYGSGYVLVAFLEGGLVRDLHWMTQSQLVDAISIGQVTPGPVFTTATFVGFVVAHEHGTSPWLGALAATVGIFLPAFVFVAILHPLIPRLRKWTWTAALLDAVNVAALGLMFAVTVKLARDVLWTGDIAGSMPAWVLGIVALMLVVRFNVNAAWLVIGGGVAGWLLGLMGLIS
jgi:chromate transporter